MGNLQIMPDQRRVGLPWRYLYKPLDVVNQCYFISRSTASSKALQVERDLNLTLASLFGPTFSVTTTTTFGLESNFVNRNAMAIPVPPRNLDWQTINVVVPGIEFGYDSGKLNFATSDLAKISRGNSVISTDISPTSTYLTSSWDMPSLAIIFEQNNHSRFVKVRIDPYLNAGQEALKDAVERVILSRNLREKSNIIDLLAACKFSEQAIDTLEEYLDRFRQVEEFPIATFNRPVKITDVNGESFVLKASPHANYAFADASLNYHLSRLGFIPGSVFAEPLYDNKSGIYVNLFKFDPSKKEQQPIEYWIKRLATLHRDGLEIMEESGVLIPKFGVHDPQKIREYFNRSKRYSSIGTLDMPRLEDAISYLENSRNLWLVQGDMKRDNFPGSNLYDFERGGLGNPAIDLSMLMMEYDIDRQYWDFYATFYLTERGCVNSLDREMDELMLSMDHAKVYMGSKEVFGTYSKFEKMNHHNQLRTDKHNRKLALHFN